ncbi:hypothetical protein KSP39_PZI015521 [Platanthera zijinensis]|uniref:Magnesium transporter CorA-like family protein n=1 Tax=Platanthera zijinensis TaxID=2320716 RepID=A0AAP0B8X6_9ASPA
MEDHKPPSGNKSSKQDFQKFHSAREGALSSSELWTDGLICAFEYVRRSKHRTSEMPINRAHSLQPNDCQNIWKQDARTVLNCAQVQNLNDNTLSDSHSLVDINHPANTVVDDLHTHFHKGNAYKTQIYDSHWIPIGWARISELVQIVQVDSKWSSQQIDLMEGEDDFTVAGVAAPYRECPEGPIWWCHVSAGHHFVVSWLNSARWLHPAISIALTNESRLISERMKYLLYEVPVRVAGGLLFELLGQSVGDPFCDEDDTPIVLRSWQAQNFLVTAMHVKGSASNINVLGVTEVQELLFVGDSTAPRSVHEVIAHLACRLSRWDDRLFRKFVFGAADEIELKFVNRRSYEDLNPLSIILNQEIRRLATQVIRVKWSLHAREEIIFELLQHLKGTTARTLLEGIRKSTREMLEEQEAVRGRLFTVQDVLQSTVRAWLQDQSLRITHNLAIFGGCGVILSVITGLFGINVDGIPGSQNTPYAFGLFAGVLVLIGIILIGLGMLYFGLKKLVTEEEVNARKFELQQLVSMFQHDAETHAKVREGAPRRHNLPPTAGDVLNGAEYLLIA